jgi:subtilisin-like proprotein convertase family protein
MGDGFAPPAPVPSGLSTLGGFRGKNPEGAWQLFVDDQFNEGEGILAQGYSLKIKAKFRP